MRYVDIYFHSSSRLQMFPHHLFLLGITQAYFNYQDNFHMIVMDSGFEHECACYQGLGRHAAASASPSVSRYVMLWYDPNFRQ